MISVLRYVEPWPQAKGVLKALAQNSCYRDRSILQTPIDAHFVRTKQGSCNTVPNRSEEGLTKEIFTNPSPRRQPGRRAEGHCLKPMLGDRAIRNRRTPERTPHPEHPEIPSRRCRCAGRKASHRARIHSRTLGAIVAEVPGGRNRRRSKRCQNRASPRAKVWEGFRRECRGNRHTLEDQPAPRKTIAPRIWIERNHLVIRDRHFR